MSRTLNLASLGPIVLTAGLAILLVAVGCSSLDCESAGGKISKSYSIGVSYGGVGISYGVSEEEATKFNGKLGALSLRYQENCEAFRDGLITKDEYTRRNRELDPILASVQDFSREWQDWVSGLKGSAMGDMDKAFANMGAASKREAAGEEEAKTEAPPQLRKKFDDVMAKLDSVDK